MKKAMKSINIHIQDIGYMISSGHSCIFQQQGKIRHASFYSVLSGGLLAIYEVSACINPGKHTICYRQHTPHTALACGINTFPTSSRMTHRCTYTKKGIQPLNNHADKNLNFWASAAWGNKVTNHNASICSSKEILKIRAPLGLRTRYASLKNTFTFW